jgi:hypothetical protein
LFGRGSAWVKAQTLSSAFADAAVGDDVCKCARMSHTGRNIDEKNIDDISNAVFAAEVLTMLVVRRSTVA